MITTLATSQNNNKKKTLSPSCRDFVAKFSAAKYDFNLYKGFFKGKNSPKLSDFEHYFPNPQILMISSDG
jgi:hypothetical protein